MSQQRRCLPELIFWGVFHSENQRTMAGEWSNKPCLIVGRCMYNMYIYIYIYIYIHIHTTYMYILYTCVYIYDYWTYTIIHIYNNIIYMYDIMAYLSKNMSDSGALSQIFRTRKENPESKHPSKRTNNHCDLIWINWIYPTYYFQHVPKFKNYPGQSLVDRSI